MSVETFDTNVLVYACDKSNPGKREIAQRVMDRDGGVILWQVAVEFIAASRKLAEQGFMPTDAWRHLGFLLDALPLVVPHRRVLESAKVLHVERRWSWWDSLIVAACCDAGVTRLYSEDVPGQAPPEELEIVNPFD